MGEVGGDAEGRGGKGGDVMGGLRGIWWCLGRIRVERVRKRGDFCYLGYVNGREGSGGYGGRCR